MTASNQPTLNDYARRMRVLIEDQVVVAADLRELAREMRERGMQAVVLKAWIKAQLESENGNEKAIERIIERTEHAIIYADALGFQVQGTEKTKHIVVNDLPDHDPETGEIIEDECGVEQSVAHEAHNLEVAGSNHAFIESNAISAAAFDPPVDDCPDVPAVAQRNPDGSFRYPPIGGAANS